MIEKEFIKKQIENLKKSTTKVKEVQDTNVMNDEVLNQIDGPVCDTAYTLLKMLIGDDWEKVTQLEPKWEELVFSTFLSYLYDAEITLDSFLEWFDTYIMKK